MVALAIGIGFVPGARALTSSSSRCLGAASHDPRHACSDPHLRFTVTPSVRVAGLTPNAPCAVQLDDDGVFHALQDLTGGVHVNPQGAADEIYNLPIPAKPALPPGALEVHACLFGTPPPLARSGIALVGDSHAETWRAALAVVANSFGWDAASLVRSSCPYSAAVPILSGQAAATCRLWRQGIVSWFTANPSIGTMFVSGHASARVVRPPGRTLFAAQVAGYLAAWRELPRTVTHIVVLRDTPGADFATAACIDAATVDHEQPGIICALPQRIALPADPAVAAASQFKPRASVIDMSHFFCDHALCRPVIGGVLVYKDSTHMTRLFSDTLGPYLRSAVGALVASWPAAAGPTTVHA